jgi:hypothetical protein
MSHPNRGPFDGSEPRGMRITPTLEKPPPNSAAGLAVPPTTFRFRLLQIFESAGRRRAAPHQN